MSLIAVRVLHGVVALALAGSVFVQVVMLPLLWIDLEEAPEGIRLPFIVIVLVGIITLQVTGICIWKLLTMVRVGTVFSHGAFRYVDIITGAIAVAALLFLALGTILAPGEDVAPGVVLLLGGMGLVVAGVSLLVYVLRSLLAQAVARDAEAAHLQAELNEVI